MNLTRFLMQWFLVGTLDTMASPSSSDEEVEGDEHDIHTVRGELAVAG
jgi:hypothetical protein